MAGYVRQSTADIIPTATVRAAPINAEYNALRDAFAASGGHKHDGTSGEGEYVPLIADLDALNKVVIDTTNNRVGVFVEVSAAAVEQIRIQDGVIVPVTDNDIDLGTSSLEFKDLYLDGTAYIDTLAVHESATITSNFSVNGNTTLGNAASDTVTFTADIASAMLPSADNTHDLGAVGSEWRNLYIDGTANIDALIADTATISAGTIDNTVIGGSTAVAGSFSTINSSGATTLASLTVSGATALNGGLTLDTNKFTVADTSGNTAIAGTLDVTGATTVADFTATGTTVLPATSFGDNNITNVGNIALDSITADGSSITITGNTTFADGAYDFDVASHDGSNGLKLAGTLVTSSAAELNKLDGATVTTTEINILDGDNSATSTTVADADRVVMNDNGTMVQVAVTDLAAYFDDEITAMPNLVTTAATTVGALNSGSITSGFGSIDTGSSTITTTGNITGGNVIISDGGNIGSASDTDAIAIASNGNVTLSQNLTVSGDLQVDGTTTTVNSNNLSVDDQLIELGNGRTGSATGDSGIVIERGSDANAFIGFDESADKFTVGTGTFTGTSTGDLSITTGTLVANIEGNVTGDLTGNADTATALETARTIAGQSFDGTANINIATTDLTSVTATAAEVNVMDGDTSATSTTLADADRVVVNDAGTMKQVALTDFETYFESALDTLSNVTTVGTLNSGSITSGFGSIDNGSSAITTTGTITFGTLSDGSDSVTDIVTSVGSGSANSELPTALAVENRIQAISAISNNVTGLNATGAELNAVADVSAITIDTSTAIANNDGIAVFDSSASAIGYFDVDLLDTYFAGTTKTLTNKTLTSPTVSGLYLSDAGFIVEGSSADGNESTVTFTNPTADRTITFPDATGTVALSGATQNVDFGTVTADGLTVDGDGTFSATNPTVDIKATNGNDASLILMETTGNDFGANGANGFRSRYDGGDNALYIQSGAETTIRNRIKVDRDTGDITFYDTDGATASFVYDASAGSTFNEAGADRDFRVESNNNANAFFVEGSTDHVGMGVLPTTSYGNVLQIHDTGTAGANLRLTDATSGSGTNNGMEIIQIGVESYVINREAGALSFFTNQFKRMQIGSDGSVVINDISADADFRVESNNNASMLFVDGGDDRVAIGHNSPNAKLDIMGQGTSATNLSMLIGADEGGTINPSRTDATDKAVRIGMPHRTNAEEPAALLVASSTASSNAIYIGGGTGVMNAATQVNIYTADNTTTATGVGRVQVTGSNMVVNDAAGDFDFRVESDNNANMLFVDAGNNVVGMGLSNPNSYYSSNLVLAVGDNGGITIRNTESTTGTNYLMFADGDSGADRYRGMVQYTHNDDRMVFSTNATGRLELSVVETVFNNSNADTDFRVESDNNANAIFVDAQNDHVCIGTSTDFGGVLNVKSTDNTTTLALGCTDTDANSGPILVLKRDATGADDDSLGRIRFDGKDDAGNNTTYARLDTQIKGASNGSESAEFTIKHLKGGSEITAISCADDQITMNESSADVDFRVESDANSHMLFVDAGNNRIGLDTSNPLAVLDIHGSTNAYSTMAKIYLTDVSGHASSRNWSIGNGGSDYGAFTVGVSNAAGGDPQAAGTHFNPMIISKEGNVVFNEDSKDADFRVESDGNANMLIVEAGANAVNIGKSTSAVGTVGFTFGAASMTSTLSTGNTYHLYDTSAYKFYVNANGGIYNYSGNNVNLSDQREKKNIEALDSQWDALKQWDLKKFHYKSDDDSDAKKVGVIAQDVQVNHPDLISDFQNTEDETRLAVKEQQMMWMAIKALQEAQAKIETLEAKVTALENA